MNKNQNKLNRIIFVVFSLKLALILFFCSDTNRTQIISFVDYFMIHLDNPYDFFANSNISFDYSPLMLYLLSICRAPILFFLGDNILFQNLFFSIPIFIADFIILYTLFNLFPTRKKEAIFFYFLNPIIIYSSFIQAQLDLIPTAFVFVSAALLLKNEIRKSFLYLSCATALHPFAIFSVPITIIYLLMHKNIRRIVELIIFLVLLNIVFALPFILSDSSVAMVLIDVKKIIITDTFIHFSEMKIYPALVGISIVYASLFRHKKINQDLLFSFYGILFSVFVLLVNQNSGGYIWFVPFLVCFFINYRSPDKNNLYFHLSLSICYLLFFVLYYTQSISNIKFFDNTISLGSFGGKNDLVNILFTILESIVCINIFIFYKYAINSNSYYQNKQRLSFGIGGDSGAGKSKLLTDLKDMFKNKLLDLEGDGDHKWERGDRHWDKITHLNPKANYIYEQANYIRLLKEGKSIYRKEYNHTDGTFTKKIKLNPRNYIVLCGLHPFYLPLSRKILDLKIYMDTEDKLRKHWKILRDTTSRGHKKDIILQQIEDRKIDCIKYILPQKQYADFVIHYFSDTNYQIGDKKANPQIKLKVTLDANLEIEKFVKTLEANNIIVEWDYLDNLEKQYLILHNKPPENSVYYFKEYLLNNIVNIDELIDVNMDVQWGYRGVIQILILQIVGLQLRAASR